ncbi:SpdD-like protein [Streptomyces sp. NPDC079189]|uniref:SpdD-like protein n=1 Tax=Streptomyces sp. NPDC079189 TaxID=3154514 RepID=UPI00341DB316
MIRPRIPVNPLPTGIVTPLITTVPAPVPVPVEQHHAAACACQHATPAPIAPVASGPAIRLSPAGVLAVVGGGTAVVLIVGAVLVSMLLAVAITGTSVAVCAVVLRSLLNSPPRHR